MPVNGINHVNIRTLDVTASAKFYVDVFDFEFRTGEMVMGNRPYWLIDKSGRPIIHFRQMPPDAVSTGPIDHIALDCDGQSQILGRLDALGIRYEVANVVPGLAQVFVKDPHGVVLELNFKTERAVQA